MTVRVSSLTPKYLIIVLAAIFVPLGFSCAGPESNELEFLRSSWNRGVQEAFRDVQAHNSSDDVRCELIVLGIVTSESLSYTTGYNSVVQLALDSGYLTTDEKTP